MECEEEASREGRTRRRKHVSIGACQSVAKDKPDENVLEDDRARAMTGKAFVTNPFAQRGFQKEQLQRKVCGAAVA